MEKPLILAIDWSGAVKGARRKIWLAEANSEALIRLECGRDRRELVDHLVRIAERQPVVVGLDFAFSFPAWFLRERGIDDAIRAWRLAAAEGERWLSSCPDPFWGRKGRGRPPADCERSPYRVTESERPPFHGIGPKSVFQIGGAGAVGTGSIRGMPCLLELRSAGFSVWPFDPPRAPMLVEIYPRWLTGRVRKSSQAARALCLSARFGGQLSGRFAGSLSGLSGIGDRSLLDLAASSEDAFDAAVSAMRMAEHARSFTELPPARDATEALEGRIWSPLEDPLLIARRPA